MHVHLLDGTSVGKSGVQVGASSGGVDRFLGCGFVALGLVLPESGIGLQEEILLFGLDKIYNDIQSFALMIVLNHTRIFVRLVIIQHQMLDQESIEFLLDG